jgi:hypothetical protein
MLGFIELHQHIHIVDHFGDCGGMLGTGVNKTLERRSAPY